MSTPIVNDFKGTGFAVTTGWGTPKAITAITNANPAVVTSAAHGLADGDVVKLAGVGGMTEVNGGIFAVNVLTADTYELVHLDSMDYGVYTTGGTAAEGVFSSTCQVTNYSGDSGATPVSTTDTNCGSVKSYGTPQHGQVTVQFLAAKTDYVEAMEAARLAVGQVAHRYVLPKGRGTVIDIGTVVSTASSAAANGSWTGGATIERDFPRMDFA